MEKEIVSVMKRIRCVEGDPVTEMKVGLIVSFLAINTLSLHNDLFEF